MSTLAVVHWTSSLHCHQFWDSLSETGLSPSPQPCTHPILREDAYLCCIQCLPAPDPVHEVCPCSSWQVVFASSQENLAWFSPTTPELCALMRICTSTVRLNCTPVSDHSLNHLQGQIGEALPWLPAPFMVCHCSQMFPSPWEISKGEGPLEDPQVSWLLLESSSGRGCSWI